MINATVLEHPHVSLVEGTMPPPPPSADTAEAATREMTEQLSQSLFNRIIPNDSPLRFCATQTASTAPVVLKATALTAVTTTALAALAYADWQLGHQWFSWSDGAEKHQLYHTQHPYAVIFGETMGGIIPMAIISSAIAGTVILWRITSEWCQTKKEEFHEWQREQAQTPAVPCEPI